MFDINTSFADQIVKVVNQLVGHLPSALFELALGIVVIRLLKRVMRLALKATHIQPGLRYVLTSIVESIMWILLTVVILKELGFDGIIYFFTGSIAAIGIAMAAGGSTFIADIVAGLFLAQDKDFNVGDEIAVMNDRPIVGIIESMDARRIRLRDPQGILHVVPNSIVERKEWIVIRRRPEVTALVKATKAAKRFGAVAREKRAVLVRKRRESSNNDQ